MMETVDLLEELERIEWELEMLESRKYEIESLLEKRSDSVE